MAKPIRILHVVTSLERAGLETMLMNYYRNIDRSKIQFDFLVHRERIGQYEAEVLSLGGKIYRLPELSARNMPSYIKSLHSFLLEHDEYRIIHSHIDALSALPLFIAKKAGLAVRIAHSHTTGFDIDYKLPLRWAAKKFIWKFSTHTWGCSSAAIDFMFGRHAVNPRVINNGIQLERFRFQTSKRNAVRSKLMIKSSSLVLGHIGRFSKVKNHEYLINIFNEISKKRNDSILLLVGDGELTHKIKHQTRELGLSDKVVFLGEREDTPELLQAMDIFVMPSLYEGFGIAALEAIRTGLFTAISPNTPLPAFGSKVIKLSLKSPIDDAHSILTSWRHVKNSSLSRHSTPMPEFDISLLSQSLQRHYESLV